jgi:hypothetical protein
MGLYRRDNLAPDEIERITKRLREANPKNVNAYPAGNGSIVFGSPSLGDCEIEGAIENFLRPNPAHMEDEMFDG